MSTPDPRALAVAVRALGEAMDESERNEPHAILVHDPTTGRRHVIGPYPDRLTAKVRMALVKASNERQDPDLANLEYEVVTVFPAEG